MPKDDRDILKVLKFELRFLEDGGYGRSTRTAWRPSLIFEDSPTCLNFNDPDRPNSCRECLLMQFVPPEHTSESSPCRFIHLNGQRETVHSLYRWGTQREMEDALRKWLRETITWYEAEHKMGGTDRAFKTYAA